MDVEDNDTAESFELPGADLSGEEVTVHVIPKQPDEFTCTSCFLVHLRSRLAEAEQPICRDRTRDPPLGDFDPRGTPRPINADANLDPARQRKRDLLEDFA